MQQISRRGFLAGSLAAGTLLAGRGPLAADPAAESKQGKLDFPLVDYHVHRDNTTLEKLLEISRRRGVKFGIVEHAGTRENKYPIILSNDDELKSYLASLEGKPVYKGIQAEWLDWMTCFSKEMIARLDYVLSDAMTFRQPDGRRVKLWEPGATLGETQDFMDRYTDFHVEVMAREPIDILANPTWLPAALAKDYDTLWTPKRMQKIIDGAVRHGVAIEINSLYKLPSLAFLTIAKEAGVRFSFGSNIRGPDVGKLDYCVEMARKVGLTRQHIFTPAPAGKKRIERS